MENIIDVQGLAKTFSDQPALNNVSFQVKKGEIFGFLGPSGSGKTTTIKILTGQMNITSGQALVFGKPVSHLKDPRTRGRFGVLTDNSGLYERLSIVDNLKLFSRLYGLPDSRMEEVLDIVHMTKDKNKKVSSISKGMKQRVILARALLHEPELLFLDEPTSALDPVNTQHIYEGLRALNDKGTTIFLTTHDMYEADTLCDRIAFLNKGTIQSSGSPDQLKKQYSDETITVELTNGQQVILSKGAAGAEQLYTYMKSNQVSRIFSNEPTLGDIFIEITGRKLA
ncbi:ATP-binding cassette domain-containing protein [Siminovitchia sediminis]|uniref:ATP-binding cassette domain-containing protein n=1 Tax=Siminovitchia sediminis TaxID=1274353 RepID=A0ABW4KKB0_9BACI